MPDGSRIRFSKLQSTGNDFPLLELHEVQEYAERAGTSVDFALSQLAVMMCDRHLGVGGDGLLAASQTPDGVLLRMFNPDGTEDFCGNGMRCAALYASRNGWVGVAFVIDHLNHKVQTSILPDGQIQTTIGVADYTPENVPHTAFGEIFNLTVWSGMDDGNPISLFGSALTTGSTHVVIPTVSLPDDESFRSVSAKIEVAPLFPKRTSVIWRRELDPMKLQIRIWERGVGETLGCGTGSSAAAADYMRSKQIGGTVEVVNPGGTVWVKADHWNDPLTVTGPAVFVYEGAYRLPANT